MGGLCLESVKNARDHKTYNQVAPQDGNLFIFLLFLTLKAFTERSLLKQLQPYSRIQGYLWLQDVQQIIVRGECTSAVLQRFPCVGATLLAQRARPGGGEIALSRHRHLKYAQRRRSTSRHTLVTSPVPVGIHPPKH